MARSTTPKTPAKETGNAIVRWDEQLAAEATAAAAAEVTSGGAFFSTQAGQLSWQGMPLPDNQMAVIVVDAVFENIYYEGAFDSSAITPPTCFALSYAEGDLVPHETVFAANQQQHPTCKGCQWNEYGSANQGKGKACGNKRRIAMIPAGTLIKDRFEPFDAQELADAAMGYLKPPVTSVKNWAGYVKQTAGVLMRPPHGVITRVRCIPGGKNQYEIKFDALEKVSNELLPAVMKRREEAQAEIMFPYNLEVREQAPARGGRGKAAAPAGRRKM